MKPRFILTDVDEVLLQWAGGFQRWAIEEKGLTPVGSLTHSYDVCVWFNLSRDDGLDLVDEYNHIEGEFSNLPVLDHAREYVPRIAELGYSFIGITAVSNDRKSLHYREANLKKHFGDVFGSCNHVGLGMSKIELLQRFPRTIWVEDNPGHALDGAMVGHETFLITHPFNESFNDDRVTRVQGWKQIYETIISREM